jgi:nucleoside-diphosphate-sugar epimerase
MKTQPDHKRILVTGHAGFTGRHLVACLRRRAGERRIVGMDARPAEVRAVDREVVGDLARSEMLCDVLREEQPTHIVHLAGRVPPATDAELWAGTVGLSVHLLESVRTACKLPPRVLLVGSAAEYGDCGAEPIDEDHEVAPATGYGRSKLAQTLLGAAYAARWGLPVCTVRPFNLMGPGMAETSVVGTICAQLAEAGAGGVLRLGNLDSVRDFVDIRDAVAAYADVLECGLPGQVYNVASGRTITIRHIAGEAVRLSEKNVRLEFDSGRVQAGDVSRSCGDSSRLQRLTGWRPTLDLLTSLRDTLVSFRARAVPVI